MKKPSTLLFTLLLNFIYHAQTQGIAYTTVGKGVATTFVTDYHCLGINTSALGWGSGFDKYKRTVGGFEMSGGFYSDALSSDRLRNFAGTIYSQIKKDSTTKSVDWKAQAEAAAEFAEKGVSIDAYYNWGGFAYQNQKFGGIAFNVTESYNWFSKLNSTLTDIIFKGKISNYFDSLTIVVGSDTSTIANSDSLSQDTLNSVISGNISVPLNLSALTDGSKIQMVWNRCYNFGYGRKVFGSDSTFAIYAGIGGRFIQSMAMFGLESSNGKLSFSSSLSPAFKIDYGQVAQSNISSFLNYKGGIPPAVGNGYGLDFSVSTILLGKFKFAASLNNIGSVEYTRNVYTVKDTLVGSISINGLDVDNSNLTNSVQQLLQNGSILTLVGSEKYKQKNAATIRIGGSFHPFKQLSFGFDFVAPLNNDNPGSIQNPIISFGGDIKPTKWLCISLGYLGGGIYRTNLPMGVNFIFKEGKYEMGIASRDMMAFFTTNANTVSGAMGIMRMRF